MTYSKLLFVIRRLPLPKDVKIYVRVDNIREVYEILAVRKLNQLACDLPFSVNTDEIKKSIHELVKSLYPSPSSDSS